MGLFGIGGRGGSPIGTGGVTTQAVPPAASTSESTETPAPAPGTFPLLIPIGAPAVFPAPAGVQTSRSLPQNPAARMSPYEIGGGGRAGGGGGRRLPEPYRFIAPLLLHPRTKYDQDVFTVSQFNIANNEFVSVEKNGISAFRPEIISVLDFKSAIGTSRLGSENSVEATEQLLKAQYQALETRAITVQKLMNDIRSNRSFGASLITIKNRYLNGTRTAKTTLSYFGNLIEKISIVQKSLDPKLIPPTLFETNKYLTLSDFFERRMQYSKAKFGIFSDTKILNQLISDFKNILWNYSFSLLDLVDTDRITDTSPVVLDKTYTTTNGFTFTPDSLRSTGNTSIHAYKSAFFNQFLNSLPANPDDKIKVLTNFLSKELRVSKQMGRPEVAAVLRAKYDQGDTANPFDNIVGDVGSTIFEAPLRAGSLSSLTYTRVNDSTLVLPFESLYVDSETERKVYVPGSAYFVDSILEVTPSNAFNTRPFNTYVSTFDNITSTAKSTIETLLELSVPTDLSPGVVYDYFLTSVMEGTSGLKEVSGINRAQALSVAIFKLANTDPVLKNMLFQYLLLLGLTSLSDANQKKIFERLAGEINNIRQLDLVGARAGENPSLTGGSATLRHYVENIASSIENKVFSIISANNASGDNLFGLTPSPRAGSVSGGGSGPRIGTLNGGLAGRLGGGASVFSSTTRDDPGYRMVFSPGEIKQSLVNNVVSTGTNSTNFCKEFIDIIVKLDQVTAIASTPNYLVPDETFRTRYNFLSTSTIMILVFEILSSFANKYAFSTFNRGGATSEGSLIVDTTITNNLSNVIRDILNTSTTGFIGLPLLPGIGTGQPTTGLNPFSIESADLSREIVRFSSTQIQNPLNSSVVPQLVQLQNLNITPLATNTPLFNFGRDNILMLNLPGGIEDMTRVIQFKKSLVGNRVKLNEEDVIVKNILHIFSVISRRLQTAKAEVTRTFTPASLASFLSIPGNTISSLDLVRNPTQLRVSAWILDKYDERTADAGNLDETADSNGGFLITDRIPTIEMNAMFNMLRQDVYKFESYADFRVKVLSVGIPAGFSKKLSDRVSKAAINQTNFKDKQFDVVAINVYKKDARFDDIVFKPKQYLFDLSLFPNKNFLPASAQRQNLNYNQLIDECLLRDYQSLENKKSVNLANIRRDQKYNFLNSAQKRSMVRNHIESQLFELYTRLLTGLRIDEETFSTTQYTKVGTQTDEVANLIKKYLRDVKNKIIPNASIETILANPNLDQETKDNVRLLSYGNLMFQPDFVNKRILEPKLFDRVFHLPVNTQSFEIDVEATTSTVSGRTAWLKNSVQEQVTRSGDRYFMKPRWPWEMLFEDYFVVIETDIGSR